MWERGWCTRSQNIHPSELISSWKIIERTNLLCFSSLTKIVNWNLNSGLQFSSFKRKYKQRNPYRSQIPWIYNRLLHIISEKQRLHSPFCIAYITTEWNRKGKSRTIMTEHDLKKYYACFTVICSILVIIQTNDRYLQKCLQIPKVSSISQRNAV